MTTLAATYIDGAEHLADELYRLDLRIHLRLSALDHEQALDRDPREQLARSLAVDRAEVTELLADGRLPGNPAETALRAELAAVSADIAQRTAAAAAAGVPLALPRLVAAFGLDELDQLAVVVCLAPELRRRYDRLYAFLQDDITRKRPSVDLVLDLACETEPDRWRTRRALGEAGRLRRCGVLEAVADAYSPSGSSGLAQLLRLDARVLAFLLGDDGVDPRLSGIARVYEPAPGDAPWVPDAADALVRLLRHRTAGTADTATLVVLHGPTGAGRLRAALHACTVLDRPAVVVDAPAAAHAPGDALDRAFREARLRGGLVVLRDADALAGGGAAADPPTLRAALADAASRHGGPVLVTAATPLGAGLPGGIPVTAVAVTPPDRSSRAELWRHALRDLPRGAARWAPELADRYQLGPGRIETAVRTAQERRVLRGRGTLRYADLQAACREVSRRSLGGLAVRVDPCYGWDDLVLPESRLSLLREICDQVRHERQVHDRWGFDRGPRTGPTVLLSGPPGTGKTMAAQVLAADLGLDLYCVDLSQVTSKYIGETEKNLDVVFAEAQAAGALLFFDEADALFGKRSEVSDAHDRYANLEISYLLQRMERHTGVVVLATNLRQNLDDAFTRRIRFLVEFPFPDAEHRCRIWRAHLPRRAPLAPDLDVDLVARTYPLSGGSISTVVLNAAFLAAADGDPIGPAHVQHGIRREFDKIGKVWAG